MTSYEKLLPRIESRIVTYVRENPDGNLYDPIRYVLGQGGKRIRPVLALMATELFDGEIDAAIDTAIAIEIFHNFTLVHDDIMDQAPVRRGLPSIHEKWDINTAILSGDVMSIHAYRLICSSGRTWMPDVLNVFNKTAVEVCEGQQMDMDFEKQEDVNISKYLEMIRLKTAVLLAGSLKMGAIMGGASNEQQRLIYSFGENLGMAFQIMDDYLDLFGNQDLVGKQSGGDIVANKKSYLSVKAFEIADLTQKAKLQETLVDFAAIPLEKVGRVKGIFEELDIPKLALREVELYSNMAFQALSEISVSKEKKKAIIDFVEMLSNREK